MTANRALSIVMILIVLGNSRLGNNHAGISGWWRGGYPGWSGASVGVPHQHSDTIDLGKGIQRDHHQRQDQRQLHDGEHEALHGYPQLLLE